MIKAIKRGVVYLIRPLVEEAMFQTYRHRRDLIDKLGIEKKKQISFILYGPKKFGYSKTDEL